MTPAVNPWATPERVERLTELWDQGASCREIAAKLSHEYGLPISRNAVLGKSQRLKLESHAGQFVDVNHRRAQRAGLMLKGAALTRHTEHESTHPKATKAMLPPKPVHVARAAQMTATACRLDALNGHRCTFTLDAKQDGEWLFCGAPAEPRGPQGMFCVCDDHLTSDGTPGLFSTQGHRLSAKAFAKNLRRFT